MDDNHVLSILAFSFIPMFILAAIAEALILIEVAKRDYDLRAAAANIAVYVFFLLSQAVPLAIGLPGAYWLYEHRIFDGENHGLWSYALLFLLVEFFYYWFHRLGHRVRWFWANHGVHHTSNDLNILTSVRIGCFGRVMVNYAVYAPVPLLGFHPYVVFLMHSIVVGYQFWLHVEWIPKLGFLEGILNTPSAHRVHHGGNLEYLDANYGAVTIIFDRLFGTYRRELDAVPVRYGLATPMYSQNPLKVEFHLLVGMISDVFKARSVREVFGYLFAPPGWKPDGTGTTTEDLRRLARLEQQGSAKALAPEVT